MPSFRLTLAYDGTDFAGSQVQSGQRTVQGELLRALDCIDGGVSRVAFAGRTDRGVHAVGQVAAITLERWTRSGETLHKALAGNLPSDLSVAAVSPCDPAFHPRFDAAWREYRYTIASAAADPRLRRFAWPRRDPLDVDAMAGAAKAVVGRHDFATFASGGEGVPWSERAARTRGTVRTVFRCECRSSETSLFATPVLVEIRIIADGFLPRMVRNIVAALVEIGQGRRDAAWIDALLEVADRRDGPPAAPAHGVTLWHVGYGVEPIDDW